MFCFVLFLFLFSIGQFLHRTARKLHWDNATVALQKDGGGKALAHIAMAGGLVDEDRIVAGKLAVKRNMATGRATRCWFIKNRGHGFLDGSYKDYEVGSLTEADFALKDVAISRFLL